MPCCLDLLNTHKLLWHSAAVATPVRITPGHHRCVVQNGSTSTSCCLDVLAPNQLLSHPVAVAAIVKLAQDTMQPSFRMAAKAPSFAWMCWTRTNCSGTWLLFTSAPTTCSAKVTTLLAWLAGRSHQCCPLARPSQPEWSMDLADLRREAQESGTGHGAPQPFSSRMLDGAALPTSQVHIDLHASRFKQRYW